MSLCLKQSLAAVALCLHLLFHCVLDLGGRNNVLKLYTVNLDTPFVGCLVEDFGHLGIDGVAGGESAVKLKLTYDITKSGSRKVCKCRDGIYCAVSVKLGVVDGVVDDRVDLHGYVVLGNNGLRRRVKHLLLDGHGVYNSLKERYLEVDARGPGRLVLTEKLDYILVCLGHDFDAGCQNDSNECK